MNNIKIKQVDFNSAPPDLRSIRETVFIREQNVPVELEWDEFDDQAIHIIACFDEKIVGTARFIKETGRIGRMAVLKAWRGKGVGQKMLEAIFEIGRQIGFHKLTLSSQTHAIEFYKKSGCVIIGEEYLDAGIPHFTMSCEL